MGQADGGGLDLRICDDAAAAAALTARLVGDSVAKTPGIVLGLATGNTFTPVYDRLVRAFRSGRVSFARTATFNLDEYVGLAPGDPRSYTAYMQRMLFSQIDIEPDRAHLPDGFARDLDRAAVAYEEAIAAAGGIDLQLVGLGRNGHIGFNEPGSPASSRTRVVTLTESTRAANFGDFGSLEAMPRQALTMGLATILAARRIVLVATGAAKAAALARLLAGPIDAGCPASHLRCHGDVTIICDREAAGSSIEAAIPPTMTRRDRAQP